MQDVVEDLLARGEGSAVLSWLDGLTDGLKVTPDARAARVRALWHLRRFDEARAELDDVSRSHQESAAVQIARGVVALGRQDLPFLYGALWESADQDLASAMEAFAKAKLLDPSSVPAIRGLATAHRLLGDADQANLVLRTAIDGAGNSASIQNELAICRFDRQELDQALAGFDRALALDPANVEAVLLRIYLLLEMWRFAEAGEALATLYTVVASPPSWAYALDYFRHSGSVMQSAEPEERHNRESRALDAIAKVADTSGSYPHVWLARVGATEQRDGADAALEFLRSHALAAEPRSPMLRLVEAAHMDDVARGELYRRTIRTNPRSVSTLLALALFHDARSERNQSIAALDGLASVLPSYDQAALLRGNIEFNTGRPDAALRQYRTARDINPCSPVATAGIVGCLRVLGAIDDAELEAEAGIANWAGDGLLLSQWSYCALAESRYHAASERAHRLHSVDPESRDAKEIMDLASRKAGRESRKALEANAFQAAITPTVIKDRLRAIVSEDVHDRALGAVRELTWRLTRARLGDEATQDNLQVFAFIVGALMLAIAPWPLTVVLREGGFSWQWWLAAVPTGIVAGFVYLIISASWRRRKAIIGTVLPVIVAVAYVGWTRLPLSGRFAWVGFLFIAGVAIPMLIIFLLLSLDAAAGWVLRLHQKHIGERHPAATMLLDLSELDLLLDDARPLADRINRDRAARLLDSVARSQERAIIDSRAHVVRDEYGPDAWLGRFDPGVGRPDTGLAAPEHPDRILADDLARHAVAVATATRELKKDLLISTPESLNELRKQLRLMANAACLGQWGLLKTKAPERAIRRLRAYRRVLISAALLATVGPLVLWLSVRFRLIEQPPARIFALIAAVGPAILVLAEIGILVVRDVPELRKGRLFARRRKSRA